MNPCPDEREEHEHGVGTDVNPIIVSDVLYLQDLSPLYYHAYVVVCHNGKSDQ
jgi:hypothetical protein